MPKLKIDWDLMDIAEKAGISKEAESPDFREMFHAIEYGCEVSEEMLQKLVKVLAEFQKRDRRMNQWYFRLQDIIREHYSAKGNHLFAKETFETCDN